MGGREGVYSPNTSRVSFIPLLPPLSNTLSTASNSCPQHFCAPELLHNLLVLFFLLLVFLSFFPTSVSEEPAGDGMSTLVERNGPALFRREKILHRRRKARYGPLRRCLEVLHTQREIQKQDRAKSERKKEREETRRVSREKERGGENVKFSKKKKKRKKD